jgi:hypothetical protein
MLDRYSMLDAIYRGKLHQSRPLPSEALGDLQLDEQGFLTEARARIKGSLEGPTASCPKTLVPRLL